MRPCHATALEQATAAAGVVVVIDGHGVRVRSLQRTGP
jgi:hypothetical protein